MNVNWNKCTGDSWCSLKNLNLAHEHFDGLEGVYVIWRNEPTRKAVRVGQGIIRDRLAEHRENTEILAKGPQGLFVTWSRVDVQNRDGVEAFLAEILDPLVGERFPDVVPVPVNLPW